MVPCQPSDHDSLVKNAGAHDAEPFSCPDCGEVLFVPPGWNWFPFAEPNNSPASLAGARAKLDDSDRIDPLGAMPLAFAQYCNRSQSDRLRNVFSRYWRPCWAYDLRQYALFSALSVGVTAAGLFAFEGLLENSFARTHAFLYERSPVQWAILVVFVFIVIVIGDRLLRYFLGVRPQIKLLQARGERFDDVESDTLGDRWSKLNGQLGDGGPRPAIESVKNHVAEDQQALESTYQRLKRTAPIMLPLGLFGTLLGMHDTFQQLGASGDV